MLATVRSAHRWWAYHSWLVSLPGSKRSTLSCRGHSFLTTDDKEEPALPEDSLNFSSKRTPRKKAGKENKENNNFNSSSEKNIIYDKTLVGKNKNLKEIKILVKAYEKELKNRNRNQISYLLNQYSADKLLEHLSKDLSDDDIIAESNPGLGILTRTLLKQTSNKIIIFEPQSTFASDLEKSLLPENANRLSISHLDLQKFYTYYVHGKKVPEKDKLQDLLQLFNVHGKVNRSSKIVGVVCDPKFFFRLTLSYVFRCCFYESIFPVLYLYIPYKIYSRISLNLGNFSYSKIGVPFQFYFKFDLLDSVPREGFYPIYTLAASTRKRQPEDDLFHLVRISTNHEFTKEVPLKELENFHYFLNRICLTKKSETLISQLEKWIPDCGPEFIKNGFRVFGHPSELTKAQLLQSYYIFSKLPSYEGSMFHHYRRQWAMQFGEKDDEVLRLKTEEEVAEIEDQALET